MEISNERKTKYKRLNINIEDLKAYYIKSAKSLLKAMVPHNDRYSKELKTNLLSFVVDQKTDLMTMIESIKHPVKGYDSFAINDILFDIEHPDNVLINEVLTSKNYTKLH